MPAGTSRRRHVDRPVGTEREGVIDVPYGARAGSTVTIWVDADGASRRDRSTTPTSSPGPSVYGLPTFIGISALAVLGYLGVRSLLERSRMRRWAADWAVVEPVWSRKVP